jgi:hypothetical protein
MDDLHPYSVKVVYNVNITNVTSVKSNCPLLRPFFGWAPIDTTCFGKILGYSTAMLALLFPEFKVIQRNEPVTTNNVINNIAAAHTAAEQIIVGKESLVSDIYN